MINTKVFAIIGMMAMLMTSNAQVRPTRLSELDAVLQGQDFARDYGIRIVQQGSIYYSSPSLDWGYSEMANNFYATGNGAEDVMAQLAAFQYNIRLKNPGDVITVYVYLRDDSDNCLFAGQATFKVGEKPKIKLFQQNVPIFNNVKSAEVIPLKDDDTSGQPISMGVSQQHQLLWQPWMSGAPNGLLAVMFNDGTLVTYRLSKPVGQNSDPANGMASIGIQGHYIFDGHVIDIIEVWNRPTVYFECDKGWMVFDVRGVVQLPDGSTILERPSAMTLTDVNGYNPTQYSLSTTGWTQIPLDLGKYRVRDFGWDKFCLPGNLYGGGYSKTTGEPIPATPVSGN